MITVSKSRVGVAPGTTTMVLNGYSCIDPLESIASTPIPSIEVPPSQMPVMHSRDGNYLYWPYEDAGTLKGTGLGMVVSGKPVWVTPVSNYYDCGQQFNGVVPTDDELGYYRTGGCTTPFHSGWSISKAGLQDATEEIRSYAKQTFWLNVLSTLAIVATAGTAVYEAVSRNRRSRQLGRFRY